MIEAAFHTLLVADPAIKALVGGRVYFTARPQDVTQACVVLTLIDKTHPHTFAGHAGYAQGRMQVDAYGTTYQQAKQLAQAVREALDNYSGTAAGLEVGYITVDSERDIPANPPEGREVPILAGVSLDFLFMHVVA